MEEEEEKATKHECEVEDLPDPLSPTSKNVRHLGVKGQYERKARNVMLQIDKFPEIIKANREGELVVNGHLYLTPTLHYYFEACFLGRTTWSNLALSNS